MKVEVTIGYQPEKWKGYQKRMVWSMVGAVIALFASFVTVVFTGNVALAVVALIVAKAFGLLALLYLIELCGFGNVDWDAQWEEEVLEARYDTTD